MKINHSSSINQGIEARGQTSNLKTTESVDTENHTVKEAKPRKINLQLEPVSVGTL